MHISAWMIQQKKKIFNKNPPKVHTNHINEIDLKLKKQNKNMKKR